MKLKLGNSIGILSILSVVLYSFFFSLSRKQFTESLLAYSLLFLCLLGLYYTFQRAVKKKETFLKNSWRNRFFQSDVLLGVFIIGIIFRGVLLTYTPNLSQDFFRFIWDGHQLLNGYNPYVYLPDHVIKDGAAHIPNAALLHANMGTLSSGHYTNYPPLNQLFFAISAFLGGKSITATMIWMRVFIILADIGIFIIGVKMLRLLGKSPLLIALYYLNPFVIIELTGNLHWEGVMAFLLLTSMFLLFVKKYWFSAVLLGYGILLKLLPVIVLPLLFRNVNWKRLGIYYSIVLLTVILGFAPFLSEELINNYAGSVGLWFSNFEFNGSIYYVIRAIGFKTAGYNIIETAGKILPIITFLIIMTMSLSRNHRKKEVLLSSIVLSFFIYLLFSTTVHPWYLILPLLFSVFTSYRFMLVWSFTIFLSYQAYSNADFSENPWLICIEYLLVVIMFIFDHMKSKKKLVPISDLNH